MPVKRKPVEWKYPSEELLRTPSPYNTPEYREHLEAIGAYGEFDDFEREEMLCHITGQPCIGDPLFCEECPIMLDDEEAEG